MKQIVIDRKPVSSDSIWNPKFEDFFKHYGFLPRLCRPYRPQTKGKIENMVKFVKKDFFMGGNFNSFSDLNSQLQQWLLRVNSTIQGTTHEITIERLRLNASTRLMAFCRMKLLRKNQEKYQRMHFDLILVMDIRFLINLQAELPDFRSKRQLLPFLSEKSWSAVMISYLDTEKFRAIRTTLKDCFQRSLLKIQLLE